MQTQKFHIVFVPCSAPDADNVQYRNQVFPCAIAMLVPTRIAPCPMQFLILTRVLRGPRFRIHKPHLQLSKSALFILHTSPLSSHAHSPSKTAATPAHSAVLPPRASISCELYRAGGLCSAFALFLFVFVLAHQRARHRRRVAEEELEASGRRCRALPWGGSRGRFCGV